MPVSNVVTATTIETDWGNDVANSVTAIETELANATNAPTPNRLIERDAAGRAQVVSPTATADIATKGYSDALGTSAATASTIMRRDASGRAKVAAPSATTDIAILATVRGDNEELSTNGGPGGSGLGGLVASKVGLTVHLCTDERGYEWHNAPGLSDAKYRPVNQHKTVPGVIMWSTGGSWIFEPCLVRITTGGSITPYKPTSGSSNPFVATAPDGWIWFTASYPAAAL